MGPSTCPIAAFMEGSEGKSKPYFRGTLIRFGGTASASRSKARQLETKAPLPFANFYVPGAKKDAAVSFVAPLAETQDLSPKKGQYVCVAVGGVTDVLVNASSPAFDVFPGDRIYVKLTTDKDGFIVTPQKTHIELGVAAHYHSHKSSQSIIRVCLK